MMKGGRVVTSASSGPAEPERSTTFMMGGGFAPALQQSSSAGPMNIITTTQTSVANRPYSAGNRAAGMSALRFIPESTTTDATSALEALDHAAAVEQRLRVAKRPRGSRGEGTEFEFSAGTKPPGGPLLPRCDAATVSVLQHDVLKVILADVIDETFFQPATN